MKSTKDDKAVQIITHSPEETQRLGRRLGELAQPGFVYLLSGQLGAGKTCLTQGIAKGLGVKGNPRSPTFVMVTQHAGRMTLYHVDLYRIKAEEDTQELGLEEYFNRDGLTVVEWAERAPGAAPDERLDVTIAIVDEDTRSFTLEPHGERYQRLVRSIGPL
jgi:tRNA threonylcarbamoyladenosine biosynthesis protein TsaE